MTVCVCPMQTGSGNAGESVLEIMRRSGVCDRVGRGQEDSMKDKLIRKNGSVVMIPGYLYWDEKYMSHVSLMDRQV